MAESRTLVGGTGTNSRSARERAVAKGGATPPRFETPDLSIRLTPQEEEREIRANERNGWGFSRATAASQLERYFNGDVRTKVKVYSRFEDANFHGLNRALESGDPVKLRDWMNETYDDVKPSKKEKELYRRLGLNVR